jgi:hypothetical protein
LFTLSREILVIRGPGTPFGHESQFGHFGFAAEGAEQIGRRTLQVLQKGNALGIFLNFFTQSRLCNAGGVELLITHIQDHSFYEDC